MCVCVSHCVRVCFCVSACGQNKSLLDKSGAFVWRADESNDSQMEGFMRALKAACTSSLRPHTLVAIAGSFGRTT